MKWFYCTLWLWFTVSESAPPFVEYHSIWPRTIRHLKQFLVNCKFRTLNLMAFTNCRLADSRLSNCLPTRKFLVARAYYARYSMNTIHHTEIDWKECSIYSEIHKINKFSIIIKILRRARHRAVHPARFEAITSVKPPCSSRQTVYKKRSLRERANKICSDTLEVFLGLLDVHLVYQIWKNISKIKKQYKEEIKEWKPVEHCPSTVIVVKFRVPEYRCKSMEAYCQGVNGG